VGVVVPKHRRTAAERNRLKRRLREALRNAILPALDAGGLRLDVIVRARREAYEVAGYGELVDELTQWLERRFSHVR
jgi:ribonuclease P protein component